MAQRRKSLWRSLTVWAGIALGAARVAGADWNTREGREKALEGISVAIGAIGVRRAIRNEAEGVQ